MITINIGTFIIYSIIVFLIGAIAEAIVKH